VIAMNADSSTRGDSTLDGWLRFRLEADLAGAEADIELRSAGDRWVSVSHSGGLRSIGIGPTARAAIVASLDRLGSAAVAELLADLSLFEVSCRLLQEASSG
jgi:hypothetical protein